MRALLLDLDGTLTDSDPLHYRLWREVLAEYGVEMDPARYRREISGRLNPDIVADLLPQLGEEAAREVAEGKEAAFRERAAELERLPGLTELLERARAADLRLALVTNAPRANARTMLRAIDLEGAFDTEVLAYELPRGKPDPLAYRTALEHLGVEASDALAFEDSPSGVRSASGAGVVTVGLTTGHDPATLREAGAAYTAPHFDDPGLWAPDGPLAFLGARAPTGARSR